VTNLRGGGVLEYLQWVLCAYRSTLQHSVTPVTGSFLLFEKVFNDRSDTLDLSIS
jgi:hypothetical protein